MDDSSRPNDPSRQMSYGVTPQALKSENAHQWSDSVIHNIENVTVETPRDEQPPALSSQQLPYSSYTSKSTGISSATAPGYGEAMSTSEPSYGQTSTGSGQGYGQTFSGSGTAGTISDTVSQKATEAKDAMSNMYNSATTSAQTSSYSGQGYGQTTGQGYGQTSSNTGTGAAISDTVSQKATEAKDAMGNMYNSAANTVSNMTQGSQNTDTGVGSTQGYRRTSAGPPVFRTGPTTTDNITSGVASGVNAVSNTVGSAYNSAANTISQATSSTPSQIHSTERSTIPEDSMVPNRVLVSDALAGQPLEAASEPAAVQHKNEFENELLDTVKPTPAINDTTGIQGTTSGALASAQNTAGGVLASAQDTARSAAATVSNTTGAAVSSLSNTANSAVSSMTNAFQNTSLNTPSTVDNSQATTSVVPDVVKESQIQAHQSPEASADPSAVRHKQAFEEELLGDVRQTPATTTNTTAQLSNTAGNALNQATNTASNLAGQAAESVKAVAASDTVQQGTAQVTGLLGNVWSGAAGVASALATQAGQSIQNMTAPSSQPTARSTAHTSNLTEHAQATTGVTPAVVMESQEISNVDPEASGFRSSVEHKQAMENELLKKVDAAPAVVEGSSSTSTGLKRPQAQTMDTEATINVVKDMPGGIW